MKFTKLTEAEQAEFMELIKDPFDPELYSENDLPMLRACRKRREEEQRQEKGTPEQEDDYSDELDEDFEPPSWSDPWRWEGE